jgi:hypothetical protein
MFVIHADAEEIAGVKETHDLTSAVGEELVQLERTAGQSEYTRCRITFVE